MIVTQTPLRVSFFGGGTDFRGYYAREEGCVLSTAIDKHVYAVLKPRFDDRIRVAYTRNELVDGIDELDHELVREAMRMLGIGQKMEIAFLADIPAAGSGLGSSSSVTVGVLNGLYAHLNDPQTRETLARQACQIEIDVLGKPIGKQDQYIAAYGGLRFIRFLPNEEVVVEPIVLSSDDLDVFSRHLLLFYTNISRAAETVLVEQKENIDNRMEVLRGMRDLAYEGRSLLQAGDHDAFGRLLHQGWELKKQMASKISNGPLNDIYAAARRAGALGGKITGAGGGGFMLLYCPLGRQRKIREALRGLRELPFGLESDGSKVVFDYRR